ncbi:TlpA family protein disulfide reductase [Mesorhizobium sp. ORM16]|uniref:TlpA family protein disulfide reductase n=1 Tax=Mesorhizobium sp. ORM16 TaxID=3376989 RepID=UPI003857478F
MVLRIEAPAPAIKVTDWLRGKPLANFQPGKVYLVEFWATGCGTCVAAIPHLMQLQDKFKNSGLEVVGSQVAKTARPRRRRGRAWMLGWFRDSPI